MANLTMETAVEYLLSAPKVVRELQPVHWMFLDAPPDGSVMLVWQPLNHLGTNFASDGYVWGDAEQVYTSESRGYTVEMWLHRCGYHPPHESVATHARRRFRLTPSKTPNPNLPPPDPSLWIIHYCKAPSIDQIPATHIAVPPAVHNILAQRRFLQSQGQLARKEFMLHDRNNWPTINLPPQVGQQHYGQPGPYGQQYMVRQPQAPFFQPPPPAAMPHAQAKVPRPRAGAPVPMSTAPFHDLSLDDEEVSTGDFLDNITQREISRLRYRHNHEWMEELFDSPYNISQILPVDLGLGRKGELESLTKGYLSAPTNALHPDEESELNSGAVQLDSNKMNEFTEAANKRVADVTAEIEALKRKHASQLEKLKRLTALKEGEICLRDAYVDPTNVGTEFWRVEDRLRPVIVKEDTLQQEEPHETKPKTKVADITNTVQEQWGESIMPLKSFECVDKGGFQEPVNKAPKPTIEASYTADIDMANTAETPKLNEPQNARLGAAETRFEAGNEALGQQQSTRLVGPSVASQGASRPNTESGGDVDMGGVGNNSAPSADQLGEDWIVVNKDEKIPADETAAGRGPPRGMAADNHGKGLESTAFGGSGNLGTPDVLESSNFDDATGFNSAGEALAAYDDNDGLDLGGLDNSAFGDAFHASEGEHQHHDTEDMP
ncbi:hypothetical protein LOZ58_006084 [Ophidiomyces ophidiicola]|nr:hypothetical protein LOZ65_004944 [Ophidiomyces ophidiicola]KAI1956862.1 hypothetical protein LOZ58_006084 [Ophidiomyces ophidiicola]